MQAGATGYPRLTLRQQAISRQALRRDAAGVVSCRAPRNTARATLGMQRRRRLRACRWCSPPTPGALTMRGTLRPAPPMPARSAAALPLPFHADLNCLLEPEFKTERRCCRPAASNAELLQHGWIERRPSARTAVLLGSMSGWS